MMSLISEIGVNENIKVYKQGCCIESLGEVTDSGNWDFWMVILSLIRLLFCNQHCWKDMMTALTLVCQRVRVLLPVLKF